MDIHYFIKNRNEFTRVSRKHDCEIPKGDCWEIKTRHVKSGKVYTYYEEDCYCSLEDQIDDSPMPVTFEEV